MERILVIDDDVELCTLVAEYLAGEGFQAECIHAGDVGLQRALKAEHILVVLDVMLPGLNGFEVLRRLRASLGMAVLLLTARGEDVDRILGLELGADDYLPKPFNPRELVARINAVLRRQAAAQTISATNAAVVAVWGWGMDFRLRDLRNPDGARVAMTSAEFDLLRTFCERPGRVLSRDSLLDFTQGRNVGSFQPSTAVLGS